MKKINFTLVAIATVCLLGSCSTISPKAELKNDVDTLSYYFGYSHAEGVKSYLAGQAGIDSAYMEDFYKGFKEGAEHYSPKDIARLEGMRIAQMINNQWVSGINREVFADDSTKTVNRKALLAGFYQGVKNNEIDSLMINAKTIADLKMNEVKEIAMQEKKAAGEKFLAENKSKNGVITTESGLQYKVITEGKGEMPADTSTVKVNYRGTLIDGTEFDSSYKNNQPASFRVNQVIKGWTEALQMMPAGSKWELYIPQELAYGASGRPSIPPYSTLIFEVELLEIEK